MIFCCNDSRDALRISENFVDAHHCDCFGFFKKHQPQAGKFFLFVGYLASDFIFRLIPALIFFKFIDFQFNSIWKVFICDGAFLIIIWTFELIFFHFSVINKQQINKDTLFKYSFSRSND